MDDPIPARVSTRADSAIMGTTKGTYGSAAFVQWRPLPPCGWERLGLAEFS
jgi:hypothetical protein